MAVSGGALPAVAGLAILLLLSFDVVVTTLMLRGAGGPLAGRLIHLAWWLLGRLRSGAGQRELLAQASGPAVVLTLLCSWSLLLWLGWGLLTGAPLNSSRRNARPPPAPERAALLAAGLPVVEEPVFASRYHACAEHRQRLHAWLQADGWEWSDVHDAPDPPGG